MLSLLFYLIVLLILGTAIGLFYYRRRQAKRSHARRQAPSLSLPLSGFTKDKKEPKLEPPAVESVAPEPPPVKQSDYDPNLIVLHISAFPGRPYMGYELHQAILASGLRFGERNIFHRYADETSDSNKILFSLAAATPTGSFAIEDMGSFKCHGLLLFMVLEPKRKLMASFDLMLDTARQLAEELGGEIYDDLHQLINAEVIRRLREKICTVDTSNLYVTDLLDNLD